MTPPRDEEFLRRYRLISDGKLPLYYAKIPSTLVRPFAPQFFPQHDSIGAEIFTQLLQQVRTAFTEGEGTPPIWVYPTDDSYLMSDDYMTFFAYREIGLKLLPSLVMGEPTVAGPTEVMGPAPEEFVRKVTGPS